MESAHNLLAACLDNHLYHDNALRIDPRQILFRRAMDMNDRALREIVLGLGGRFQGYPREEGFLITAASEVMALLCLAEDLMDLKTRLGRILLALHLRRPPGARRRPQGGRGDGRAPAATPSIRTWSRRSRARRPLVHGGPFANIAHGCNSVIATKLALKLGEICVTEAGFGFDLGAEKFFDIKCGYAGIRPDAVVLVATARALKYHGGVPMSAVDGEDLPAIKRGMANLEQHVENIRLFGVPLVVALNRFPSDTDAELAAIVEHCAALGVRAVPANVFGEGGAGGERLAAALVERPGARAVPVPAALRLGGARQDEDPHDRDADVRGGARGLHEAGGRADRPGGEARLRRLADLHGQDAALPLGRPDPPRPAPGLHGHRERGADLGGRRLPGPDHR